DGEEWSVTASTNDGTPISTIATTDNTAFVAGLEAGTTYIISVTSLSTVVPGTLVVSPTVAEIYSFTADLGEETGSVILSWSSDIVDGAWRIVYTPKFSTLTNFVEVTGDSATLTNLIPGTTYQFELQTAAGQTVSGEGITEAILYSNGSFTNYGTGSFFLGLFEHPGKENWSKGDLTGSASQFATDTKFAFGVDALSGRNSSDDSVDVLIVIRDSMDVPYYYEAYSGIWDDLWSSGLFLGEATTPSEPGDYSLELYFDHKLAISKTVEVV
ncbi:MAG: fibronectin type III domain-containing protein, partial [Eubacteriales bacterium]